MNATDLRASIVTAVPTTGLAEKAVCEAYGFLRVYLEQEAKRGNWLRRFGIMAVVGLLDEYVRTNCGSTF